MKYLREYTEKPMAEMLDKNGAFFAFGTEQFNEKKVEGVKYVKMGMGLVAPKENAKTIWNETDRIHKEGIIQDMKEHSKAKILQRECANYEIQYGDSEPVYDALKEYPITRKEIDKGIEKFIQYCIKHDMY